MPITDSIKVYAHVIVIRFFVSKFIALAFATNKMTWQELDDVSPENNSRIHYPLDDLSFIFQVTLLKQVDEITS